MKRINFENGKTKANAETMNAFQNNIEEAIGEVVESGSNVNGEYIKFSDGTLIQTGTGECPANVGYADITFAIAFLNTDYMMLANHKYTSGAMYGNSDQLKNIVTPQKVTKSTAYVYSYLYDGIASYKRQVQYIAIGKWK